MKKVYVYQIVEEKRHPRGHMQYLIQYKGKNERVSGKWVGEYQLRHLYREGRLTGHMSDRIRHVIGRDLSMRKGRPRKKGVETEAENETDNEAEQQSEQQPTMYKLPDVFEVER